MRKCLLIFTADGLKQLIAAMTVVVFLGSYATVVAAPMSPQDLDTLKRTSEWYNTQSFAAPASCGTGTGGPLTGADNEEKIFNFFTKNKGLPAHVAAGFMGNMWSESRLDPTAIEPGGTGATTPVAGRGFGLIQWTFPVRQDPLVARAEAAGVLPNDLGIQLEYIIYEISPGSPAPYGGLLPQLQTTTDVTAATRLIEDKYEIHAGGPQPMRITKAKEYLAKYGSGATTPGAPAGTVVTGCAAGGAGEMVGELALPVDRKWYTDPRYGPTFTRTHHNSTEAVDIALPAGTPVYSMTGGKVHRAPIATATTGYGLGVEIVTPTGVHIKYAHGLDGGVIVKPGDTVQPGQLIMHVGSTGDSTGPHIHLEISLGGQNGIDVCPQPLMKALYENLPIPSFESLPTSGCTR